MKGLIGFGDRVQVDGQYGTVDVSLTTGSGSATVNFDEEFSEAPHVFAMPRGGDDGEVNSNNEATGSVDIEVSDNTTSPDATITVQYFAIADQVQ